MALPLERSSLTLSTQAKKKYIPAAFILCDLSGERDAGTELRTVSLDFHFLICSKFAGPAAQHCGPARATLVGDRREQRPLLASNVKRKTHQHRLEPGIRPAPPQSSWPAGT